MDNWHIRYSPRVGSLFSGLGKREPAQHAVDNETIKTFCGRDASDYSVLDEDCWIYENINCQQCLKSINKEI